MSRRPGAPLACVVGGDMDLVRPLGLAGIRCAVVTTPRHPNRYSRFTDVALDWVDPLERGDELVERLVAFARTQPDAPVLYYEGDIELLFVSRRRADLAPHFRFLLPESELVEALVDKARFQGLAERLALPVPRGVHLDPGEPAGAALGGLAFPVVVKPVTRTESWRAAGWHFDKAVEARSAEELERLWPRLAAARARMLVQELVPGPETLIESYHVYVDAHGAVAAEFTGRKLRTNPPRYGYSTALVITAAADVAALGRELVARIGLRGVAKLDFKRAPDGSLQLLEVNPRFTLWHHPAARAGVNVPAVVYDDLVGRRRRASGPVRAGVRWCDPRHDRASARADGVSLPRWLAWAARTEAKSMLAWDDPLPALRGLLWRKAAERLAPAHANGRARLRKRAGDAARRPL